MSLITLGKIFVALSATVGGGTSIYFLAKPSNSESLIEQKPKVDRSKPFRLELLDTGMFFFAKSEEQAKELVRDSYNNERHSITQLPACILSSSTDAQNQR